MTPEQQIVYNIIKLERKYKKYRKYKVITIRFDEENDYVISASLGVHCYLLTNTIAFSHGIYHYYRDIHPDIHGERNINNIDYIENFICNNDTTKKKRYLSKIERRKDITVAFDREDGHKLTSHIIVSYNACSGNIAIFSYLAYKSKKISVFKRENLRKKIKR